MSHVSCAALVASVPPGSRGFSLMTFQPGAHLGHSRAERHARHHIQVAAMAHATICAPSGIHGAARMRSRL